MAYTFFKARGVPVGKSLVEADLLDAARDIERAGEGARPAARAAGRSRRRAEARSGRAGRDARRSATRRSAIGWGSTSGRRRSRPIATSSPARRRSSGTARWACSRSTRSRKGTIEVAKAVADVKGTTIIGGGDSIAAVAKAGVADASRTSRPAAARRWSSSAARTLPGVAALSTAERAVVGSLIPLRQELHMRTPFIAANWKMYKTVARGGRVRQRVPQPGEGHRRRRDRRRAAVHGAARRRRGGAQHERRRRRRRTCTGSARARSPARSARAMMQGGRRRVRDHRPLGAAAAVRRDRRDASTASCVAALAAELTPIVCIGETLEERERQRDARRCSIGRSRTGSTA